MLNVQNHGRWGIVQNKAQSLRYDRNASRALRVLQRELGTSYGEELLYVPSSHKDVEKVVLTIGRQKKMNVLFTMM